MPCIAFDLGGVLLTDGSITAWAALERQHGLPAVETSRIWYERYQPLLDSGAASEDDLWRTLAALRPGVSEQDIRTTFLDCYREISHGVKMLEFAANRGWCTALATNNVNAWLDYWRERYTWFARLDVICCSADLGVRKPSRSFYDELARMVGTRDCLFVDDKPENIIAASEAGFHGILADESGRWKLPSQVG